MLKKLVLLVAVISISSCSETIYITKPLPLPETFTEYPTEKELSCITDDAYEKIKQMDVYSCMLMNVIRSTHEDLEPIKCVDE